MIARAALVIGTVATLVGLWCLALATTKLESGTRSVRAPDGSHTRVVLASARREALEHAPPPPAVAKPADLPRPGSPAWAPPLLGCAATGCELPTPRGH